MRRIDPQAPIAERDEIILCDAETFVPWITIIRFNILQLLHCIQPGNFYRLYELLSSSSENKTNNFENNLRKSLFVPENIVESRQNFWNSTST